ncbi:Similar to Uncharacterized protein C1840.09; acc. no. O74482 [Pyronema omphalodes CBS 100304]|uniref:Similar to Uncharacterized protein C1840.09 acc. no. O74482 n=1 Tax=Pyronema omphalodes (strain CBS 100304) TaxID=1076935 RepID=U4L4M6_PYROM|nr:Similar to Uncharacterized protein C1840.09; acc. no. O74482 [Pyronema omphalodes CBS 100304]
MSSRTLLVCGGSGFLGSRICKIASSRNWAVTSLSRSGEPNWAAEGSRPEWASKINWKKGDVMNPETYKDSLEGVDAVVHSMGILLEADYKGVLTGKEPVVAGLKKAFDSTRATGENTVRQGHAQMTYETMNRDTAVTLAEEAASQRAKSFLYVSAIDSFFTLPRRYITTKREAESIIAGIGEKNNMRTIFIRPSFLYDASRGFTMPLAGVLGCVSAVNGLFGRKIPLLGAAGYKPLAVEDVAGAAVKALEDENVKGVVDVDGISNLATRVWREGML